MLFNDHPRAPISRVQASFAPRPTRQTPGASPRTFALLALALACFTLAACSGVRSVSDKHINTLSLPQLQRLVDSAKDDRVVLFDARSAQDFQAGHIPGALHRPLFRVDPQLGRDPTIERIDHIVVYGQNPASAPAKAVTKRLLSMRYDNVFMFEGGFDAWARAGLPVDAGPDDE